ncbi:MAG: hypothetical protein IJX86_02145 [Lachnospiraceae bacterium]|nr:hypothetical protein [Lachnospiraceae bacterium]
MFVYVGVCMLSIVIILSILLICGLPLGELTMGGKHKVWPKEFRIIAVGQLLFQIFAMYILLSAGGIMSMLFTRKITQIICFVFSVFFLFNTFMNFISTSKKEKCIMTPMSVIEAICFGVVGFQV